MTQTAGSTGSATTASAPARHRFGRSDSAQRRLHELVPGGAHTYARGSDQYPEGMAPVLVRGSGARVQDLDGNWFVEYGMGLRAVTLGHGYEPVVAAVTRAASQGVNFSRPSVWELQAAERFCAQVPGAEMVKFAKNGSDVTTAAIKLARAATGRDLVAVCSTQPFFSTDDWFVGTTAMSAGIPAAHRDLTVGFRYNDLDSVRAVLDAHPGRVAALILEQATATAEPAPGFLEGLRELADRDGFVLVFDEMITGMRWAAGGAQSVYGVVPDLSTWGKALGNGFSVSALAGRADLMEVGGLNTDDPRAFLLSTTHGAETTGLAAYLAVADAYAERDVVGIMEAQGQRLRAGVEQAAAEAGLSDHVTVMGRSSCLVFGTRDTERNPSQAFRTLFLQELLSRGVLAQSFVISAAHTDADVDATVEAVRGALVVYGQAVDAGTTDGLLQGRPVAPAMRERAAPRRLPDTLPGSGGGGEGGGGDAGAGTTEVGS
ncbi:glutamate-1-semialdehyde 2,1-aminomutase [Isoptericola cucumis]|uniref:Glutamate-1-semialdehyde 2,1-aminomutase n=1 Tax=Isoptericola cucumis TaxID=1776856 RepID=A0ABQ2B4V8_9MICO|nr:glutamate-1-semialdehyde 2,1-aminomutase [Isoptericola cucumis]GGI05863.1 glutamate-1-semialdehyde 2,1-aminomutase [Isoptericola cucumis]